MPAMKRCSKCSSLMPEDAMRCVRCGFESIQKAGPALNADVGSAMETEPYLPILRRVGIVLLLAGLIDIGVMVYCIANDISYSSSFNIFAVIAGIFLMRGNLSAVAVVRWLAAFMLAAFVCLVLAFPVLQPLGLTLIKFRLSPSSFAGLSVLTVVLLALLSWVLRELGREPVELARQADGRRPRKLHLPVALGIGLVAIIVIPIRLLTGGETARQAVSLAAQQLGDGYSYHVSSLNIVTNNQGTSVSGVVTAWSNKEVREVQVRWEE